VASTGQTLGQEVACHIASTGHTLGQEIVGQVASTTSQIRLQAGDIGSRDFPRSDSRAGNKGSSGVHSSQFGAGDSRSGSVNDFTDQTSGRRYWIT
jgi:hypothetical protein